jgi:ElaB/YqjD/DUF883 family membrane-anchored ribosome-binding protein
MTTANQAFRHAANSPAGRHASESAKDAAEAARDLGDQVTDLASDAARKAGDLASDVSRKAGQQVSRARNAAVDAYEEAHELSVQNPHISLAIALGLGFLVGVIVATRR